MEDAHDFEDEGLNPSAGHQMDTIHIKLQWKLLYLLSFGNTASKCRLGFPYLKEAYETASF